jgi:hypothetical protein
MKAVIITRSHGHVHLLFVVVEPAQTIDNAGYGSEKQPLTMLKNTFSTAKSYM